MQVAIIGAGNVGSALGTAFAKASHTVTIFDRNFEDASQLCGAIGAQPAKSLEDAVANADAIVLAIPFAASAEDVSRKLAGKVDGKVIIDVTNTLKPDYSDLLDRNESGAEKIQKWIPGAHVVKAFNTLFAGKQANPTADGQQLPVFIAGDNEQAKQLVAELASSIGFLPVDVGPLSHARDLEAMAFLNIALQVRTQGSWQSAWALLSPPTGAVKVPARTA